MVSLDVFVVKNLWGNMLFDFATSLARGRSGGTWMANNVDLLFISVYSPQELSLKRVIWNYMLDTLNRWHEDDFHSIIEDSWNNDGISASNSMILLKNTHVDYGLYYSWYLEDDFHSIIEDSWNNDGISASNSMILLKNKLKFLKQRLKEWSSIKRRNKDHDRKVIQDSLIEIDLHLDKRNSLPDDLTKRSPGPDGFTFGFFKKFWTIVGGDVTNAIKEFFISSSFPKGCNSSFIALIPKVMDDKHLKDFRPISLIGCQYKIIGKILANRLSLVFGDIARKAQLLMFKVDFNKAFDSVRWDHLDDILGKYGFGIKWRGWIRGCLQSSKASILVNGSPTDEFSFHKGLQHGDYLCRFLFILVMESFHFSFQRLIDRGLKVNVHKSRIYGVGVRQANVQHMIENFGFISNNFPFTYLGVKVGANMMRLNSWSDVVKKEKFKRLFNLKLQKDANVASKLQASNVASSFRRHPRSGIENSQFIELGQILSSISLSSVSDRLSWTLHGLDGFSVKSGREEIGKHVLVVSLSQIRWSKSERRNRGGEIAEAKSQKLGLE
nr:hypothetical protein [Tanacetum cinerariifolium]